MPQDTPKPTEHKESFFKRAFEHHHKHGNEAEDDKKDEDGLENRLEDDVKKDECEFKEYVKDDQKLVDEGDAYGGLM